MAKTSWMQEQGIEQLMSQTPGKGVRVAAAPPMPAVGATTPPPNAAASKISSPPAAAPPECSAAMQGEGPHPVGPTLSPRDAAELLRQAEMAVESMRSPPADVLPPGAAPFQLGELQEAAVAAEPANLDLIRDVELSLKVELGRTQMSLEEVLKLRKGSVVALDKLAGEPVDVYANGRLIARGEVLVLDDSFSVRVVELTAGVSKAA